MRTRYWLLAAACLMGCRSETVEAPLGPLTGTYVLRTVNGQPLPALANGSNMTEFRIVADTLRIYEGGEGVDAMVLNRPGSAGVEHETSRFRLRSSTSNGFSVEYECADGGSFASCIAAPHHVGRFTQPGLTLETSVLYRTPMVYERVN